MKRQQSVIKNFVQSNGPKKDCKAHFHFHSPSPPPQPSRQRIAHPIVLVQLPFVELKQFVTFAQVAGRLCLLQQGCAAGVTVVGGGGRRGHI